MYIFLIEITASDKNVLYPNGERHAGLAFVKANDLSTAKITLQNEIYALNWVNLVIREESHANETDNATDPILRSSYKAAAEDGFSVVVYKDKLQ